MLIANKFESFVEKSLGVFLTLIGKERVQLKIIIGEASVKIKRITTYFDADCHFIRFKQFLNLLTLYWIYASYNRIN